MKSTKNTWQEFLSFMAIVEVPLRVRVRDRRTTVTYWLSMFAVLCFGGGYMFFRQRGYQASGDISASCEFRFKGSAAVNTGSGLQIVDASEIVRQYTDGFFIATNYAETIQRRNSTCSSVGRPCNLSAPVNENSCRGGTFISAGLLTGDCVPIGSSSSAPDGQPRDLFWGAPGAAPAPVSNPSHPRWADRDALSPQDLGACEIIGWCPHPEPWLTAAHEVLNWGNLSWSVRVNVKMLSSVDSNNKLKTWAQELGPFSLEKAITGAALNDDGLSKEIAKALGPGQPGADLALSIAFFCDLDKDMSLCGLRKSAFDSNTAPFAAFRLDGLGTRSGGAAVTESDMLFPDIRILRNMTGLRLRLAITGESRESDLYTTVFNLGTILWVTFISQWVAEIVLLRLTPMRKYYEQVVYRDMDELNFPETGRHISYHDPKRKPPPASERHSVETQPPDADVRDDDSADARAQLTVGSLRVIAPAAGGGRVYGHSNGNGYGNGTALGNGDTAKKKVQIVLGEKDMDVGRNTNPANIAHLLQKQCRDELEGEQTGSPRLGRFSGAPEDRTFPADVAGEDAADGHVTPPYAVSASAEGSRSRSPSRRGSGESVLQQWGEGLLVPSSLPDSPMPAMLPRTSVQA